MTFLGRDESIFPASVAEYSSSEPAPTATPAAASATTAAAAMTFLCLFMPGNLAGRRAVDVASE